MEKKLTVVWLCHLTNQLLNEKYNIEANMCAYWMTQFVDIVKGEDIDLHIVSPNYYTNKNDEYVINGVSYHLFKYYSGIGNAKTAFVECAIFSNSLKIKIERIIESINPDIVHLFGQENINYSQGILPFIGKVPTILSFQGYIQRAELKGSFFRKYTIRKRIETENIILQRIPNISFGEFEGESKEYYSIKYGKGVIHYINFPFKKTDIDATKVVKEYDVVFWGRVTVDKGVEDLINAISILKKSRPNIRCLLLGGGSQQYLEHLHSEVERLGVKDNIVFGGFQKTNEDLFNSASKARVYVLPTHYDALPGSIRESMLMKLPVVSYPVGDIPMLNKDRDSILLAEHKNIQDLSCCIDKLLSDKSLYEKLIANGYKTVCESSDETIIRQQFFDVYRKLISQNKWKFNYLQKRQFFLFRSIDQKLLKQSLIVSRR